MSIGRLGHGSPESRAHNKRRAKIVRLARRRQASPVPLDTAPAEIEDVAITASVDEATP